MADQAELIFIRNFATTLSTQPVTFADDYQQSPENTLKRVPVLPIELPPPPKRLHAEERQEGSLTVTFKSLKPPKSFSLSIQPTDTIADIKALLASQPDAPPADAQRLLLKGKALADAKLLREYTVKDGDTINLMIRPGVEHQTNPSVSSPSPSTPVRSSDNLRARSHQRIPSVVLSPSPRSGSPSADSRPLDINLTLDTSTILTASQAPSARQSTYISTIVNPEYWQRLLAFLQNQFSEPDALQAFEDYFLASKGHLTPSEIAKIRDQVGVVGMAGR